MMNKRIFLLLATIIIQIKADDFTQTILNSRYVYPHTLKSPIVEYFHGTSVTDHYRWLEDANNEETITWVSAQNKLTQNFLENCSDRAKIKERITQLYNYQQYSKIEKHGDYYFYLKNNGLQNHAVLYRTRDLAETPSLVIDPNTFSQDGTIALTLYSISGNGSHIAYNTSTNGSDRSHLKILHIDSGKEYPEVLNSDQADFVIWKDNTSFYYWRTRYQEKENPFGLYLHILGTDQSQDQLIGRTKQSIPTSTPDNNYQLWFTYHSDGSYDIAYRDVRTQESFKTIIKALSHEDEYAFIGNVGSVFYFRTNYQAPRYRIIAINVNADSLPWQTIIPETHVTISSAIIINNMLLCHFKQSTISTSNRYTLDGTLLGSMSFPTMGSASERMINNELYIFFESILYPTSIFHYSQTHNMLSKLWENSCPFDADLYNTRQIFYQSKDGTKIPLLITHKKNIILDGNNPTMLYAYGAHGINSAPSFSPETAFWLEQGGIYAIAHIRGGGEYGPAWHRAGIIEKRQNSFDDFIAAGEYLINNNYTSPSKLAIMGGSAGGTLVAVCMQQRPELFGAVISKVPVTDMLRFKYFNAGIGWVKDYGDINKIEDFKALYAYSPLHNVKTGTNYPPLLVTTADTDQRVDPLHAKKWIARLQAVSPGKNPILLRYEINAGHGAGKPTTKCIEESADIYAFLFKMFGMEFK